MAEEYICPLTGKECYEHGGPRTDPFDGTETYTRCAFGTKDGACSIARLISKATDYIKNERWY